MIRTGKRFTSRDAEVLSKTLKTLDGHYGEEPRQIMHARLKAFAEQARLSQKGVKVMVLHRLALELERQLDELARQYQETRDGKIKREIEALSRRLGIVRARGLQESACPKRAQEKSRTHETS